MEVYSDSCETHSAGKLDNVAHLSSLSCFQLRTAYDNDTFHVMNSLKILEANMNVWVRAACVRAAAPAWDIVELKQ